jgi:hypothetical protein
MIEYRFRVPSAIVFTVYSYSKASEYLFRVPTADSLTLMVYGDWNVNEMDQHNSSLMMQWRYSRKKILVPASMCVFGCQPNLAPGFLGPVFGCLIRWQGPRVSLASVSRTPEAWPKSNDRIGDSSRARPEPAASCRSRHRSAPSPRAPPPSQPPRATLQTPTRPSESP